MIIQMLCAYTLPLTRTAPPAMAAPGSRAGGGGDIEGGKNEERNTQLGVLRNMFGSAPEAAAEPGSAADAAKLGLHLDLPLCRFSWAVLPHYQLNLNIWQPQYTLMFSALLATPPPHYYLHVLLPGGAESLGKPEYLRRDNRPATY